MIKRDLITGGNNKNVKDHISYQVLIAERKLCNDKIQNYSVIYGNIQTLKYNFHRRHPKQ